MLHFSGFVYKRTPLAATEQKWQCGASKRAPNKFGTQNGIGKHLKMFPAPPPLAGAEAIGKGATDLGQAHLCRCTAMAEVPGPGQEGAHLSPQMSASIRGRSEPEPATLTASQLPSH